MRRLFLIAFSLLSIHVAAQKEIWNPGVLVTSQNEVLTGDILFYPTVDVVVVKQMDVTNVIPAARIKFFRFHDSKQNVNRKFTSIADDDINVPQKIYEIVLAGTIPVLRRVKNNLSLVDDQNDYHYYFVYNGRIKSLKKFRGILYPGIRKFLAEEEKRLHLNPNLAADAIRYIELYNQHYSILAAR